MLKREETDFLKVSAHYTRDVRKMLFLLLTLSLGAAAQTISHLGDKCSEDYACPPQFLKIGQHCYFFSKNKTTWQDAYFTCQDLNGKFLIIKNFHQDKLLRNFLDKISIVDEERWIGGMYDWEQMLWKWGSSGMEIRYKGFTKSDPDDKELLKWHCVVLDPTLQYQWSSRSCLEEKYFICQTRLKRVNGKHYKKKHYHYDKNTGLNEVLDPHNKTYTFFKEDHSNGIDDNNNILTEENAFALRNNTIIRGKGRGKGKKKLKNKNKNKKQQQRFYQNGTEYNSPQVKDGSTRRNRRNKSKEDSMENLHTKIYYSSPPESPLHPRILTEEVSFP